MDTQDKKTIIREKTIALINNAPNLMIRDLDKVLNSGCIDFDSYSGDCYIPKIIFNALALALHDKYQYRSEESKKEEKNIYLFI